MSDEAEMQAVDAIAGMVGRDPTRSEIADALGVHASTISRRLSSDEDFRLDEVIQICRFFGVNAAEALVTLGALETREVARAAKVFVRPVEDLSDTELLDELTKRALEREGEGRTRRRRHRDRGMFN